MSAMSLGIGAAAPEPAPQKKRFFFDVSVLKLVVLSTVTFNLYQIYWFYKNWQLAKERGHEVIPFLRGLFAVLFAYSFFKEVREVGREFSLTAASSAGGLAWLYFLLQITWRLPDPMWLLGFLTVIPLAIVQSDVRKIHGALGLDPTINDRFGWLNIVGVVFGGLWMLLAIVGSFLPEPPPEQ